MFLGLLSLQVLIRYSFRILETGGRGSVGMRLGKNIVTVCSRYSEVKITKNCGAEAP